jgi:hypothetical protein
MGMKTHDNDDDADESERDSEKPPNRSADDEQRSIVIKIERAAA